MPDATPIAERNPGRCGTIVGALLFLCAVNFTLFRDHYFGVEIFPWDFWKTYYAFVAFWTNLVQHGIIPEWVPFQGMGYPFFLNPQTGFFYPPFWLFATPWLHYSLRAAAAVQALHVLWGAFGAFVLIRALTRDWRVALFAATAYHLFGGFYGNAEHPDIVRAYSWLPWLFWGGLIRDRLRFRNCLLPVLVFCAISGSYPGNIGSHITFLALYLLFEFSARWKRGENLQPAVVVILLSGIGVLLATPLVLPNILLRGYSHHSAIALQSAGWPFPDWLSLITPWVRNNHLIQGFSGDPSMISAFVGVSVLVLLFVTEAQTARQCAVWWFLLVVSLLLSLGQESLFYRLAVKLFAVLGLSRFPSSDYRGLVGLSLIVLASAALRLLFTEKEITPPRFIGRRLLWSLLIPGCVFAGIFGVVLPPVELVWLSLLWFAMVVAVYLWTRTQRRPGLLWAAIMLITCVNGWHVLITSQWLWTGESAAIEARYKEHLGFSTGSSQLSAQNLNTRLATRPARLTWPRSNFSWIGYLNGSYFTGDYGNSELEAQYKIVHDPVLLKYGEQPLEPLLFEQVGALPLASLKERLSQSKRRSRQSLGEVIPREYGLNGVRYEVHLKQPALIVVNEVWFPGWAGQISRNGVKVKFPAESVEQLLRVWRLPKGDYTLKTHFTMPYLRFSFGIASAAVAAYLIFLVFGIRILNKGREKVPVYRQGLPMMPED